jgi:hypothetical protein
LRFWKRNRIIQVQAIDLPTNSIIFEVEFSTLIKVSNRVFETPKEFYALTNEGVYRSPKPTAKPEIIRVNRLELSPDTPVIHINLKTLKKIALKNNTPILFDEISGSRVIMGPGYNFLCSKKRKK